MGQSTRWPLCSTCSQQAACCSSYLLPLSLYFAPCSRMSHGMRALQPHAVCWRSSRPSHVRHAHSAVDCCVWLAVHSLSGRGHYGCICKHRVSYWRCSRRFSALCCSHRCLFAHLMAALHRRPRCIPAPRDAALVICLHPPLVLRHNPSRLHCAVLHLECHALRSTCSRNLVHCRFACSSQLHHHILSAANHSVPHSDHSVLLQ